MSTPFLVLASALMLAACAGANPGAAATSPAPGSSGGQSESSPASPAPVAQTTPAGSSGAAGSRSMDVSGQVGASNSFDVTGRSDLPDPVPSTARPYAEIVETAMAPLRPALRECFAPLPVRAVPRFYAVMVEADGAVHARAPQPTVLPARIAACAEGLLNGTTVNPTPPRPFAFDVFLTPDRSR